jgi:hypothetical protein
MYEMKQYDEAASWGISLNSFSEIPIAMAVISQNILISRRKEFTMQRFYVSNLARMATSQLSIRVGKR